MIRFSMLDPGTRNFPENLTLYFPFPKKLSVVFHGKFQPLLSIRFLAYLYQMHLRFSCTLKTPYKIFIAITYLILSFAQCCRFTLNRSMGTRNSWRDYCGSALQGKAQKRRYICIKIFKGGLNSEVQEIRT